LVNTTTQYAQSRPNVAALLGPSLGHVIVWQSDRYLNSGTTIRSLGVFGQRFDANDVKIGPEFRINPESFPSNSEAVVAGLPGGRFVVAWVALDGWSTGIFARIFNANGVPLGNPILVNTITTRAQTGPRIATLAGGGFVVVWHSHHHPTTDYRELEVRAQRFGAIGTKIGGEYVVNTTPRLRCCVDVASLADGGFVAIYPAFDPHGIGPGIFAQRVRANGGRAGEEFRVADGFDISRPRVTALADGGFMAVWAIARADPYRTRILARSYSSAGVARPPQEVADLSGFRTTFGPDVDRLANGEVIVAYNGEETATYLQRVTSRGVKIGGALKLTPADRFHGVVAGLAEPTSPFVVAWTSVDDHELGVEARRVRVEGAPYAAPDTAMTTTRTPVVIDVLANDIDPNRGTVDPKLIQSAVALNGTVSIVANGTRLRYVPGSTCAATDTITYVMQASAAETASSTVEVTIVPEPIMSVAPVGTFDFAGPAGGPFTPVTRSLTVQNIGCAPLAWSSSTRFDGSDDNWFTANVVDPNPLAPGASATVDLIPTSEASLLAPASYTGAVDLANISNARGTTSRTVTITVEPVP